MTTIRAAARLDGDRLVIDDERAFPDAGRPATSRGPPSTEEAPTAGAPQRLGGEAGPPRAPSGPPPQGCPGRGGGGGSRVHGPGDQHPAPDLRHGARGVRDGAGARCRRVILEIARSEQTYTFQRPIDFATSVLAGAIAAGWQARSSSRATTTRSTPRSTRPIPRSDDRGVCGCRLAVEAGYGNIDIDTSTLVDLSKPTLDEQQPQLRVPPSSPRSSASSSRRRDRSRSAARSARSASKNSTVEELRAYLDGFNEHFGPGAARI